jgi:predicted RNA polymerase sigma factor
MHALGRHEPAEYLVLQHAGSDESFLKELHRLDEARDALNHAIALANSVAEAKLIRRELDSLAMP